MKIVHGQARLKFDTPFDNLRGMLDFAAVRYPDIPAYLFHEEGKDKRGAASTIRKSYAELREDIQAYAVGLLHERRLFCEDREHLAVIGANSYPWVIAHTATLFGLGIAVPLDKQLADHEVASLCQRGKVSVLAFDYAHLEAARLAKQENPQIHSFILLDAREKFDELRQENEKLLHFEDLLEAGRAADPQERERFANWPIDRGALAAIYFTSGTTSQSKGVMLSMDNITNNLKQGVQSIPLQAGGRALSVLPLHHTFEGTVGMYCLWALGTTVCINENLRTLARNMKEWKITMMLTVPLMIKTIQRQILKNIEQKGQMKKFKTGLKISRFLMKFGIDIRRRLFKDLHEAFGGELSWLVSGAAALESEIQQFFNDIGILCLSGYGLTETSPMLACCHPKLNVPGSVGLTLCGVSLAIDSEGGCDEESAGEILAKGPNIMLGYYENEEASREAFNDEGWFKTGDIGYFDRRECLHITGRAKSMIVLSNGKKAFPEEMESLFSDLPGVKAVMIWGEPTERGAVDLSARFQVDMENLPEGLSAQEESISAWLLRQVDQVNQNMTEYKKIKNFIWDSSEPVMTTTLKIKRHEELTRIRQSLSNTGKSLREWHGKRLPL